MTYSSRPDRIANFRAATDKIKVPIGMTFHCSVCGQKRSVLGRKSLGSVGRRRLYACGQCVATAKDK